MKHATLVIAAVLLAIGVGAGAQPPGAPQAGTAPAGPRYQVEIIVFANREFDPTEEYFPQVAAPSRIDTTTLRAPPVFDDSNFGPRADPLALPPPDAPPGDALEAPALPEEAPAEPTFRILQPQELQLRSEYQRLTRLQAYTPLLHAGWIQAALPENRAPVFDLALLGSVNPSGTVRLYLSRFLHVNLDITYEDAASARATAPGELDEFTFAPRYTLKTERNVRSGELHYFDHPAFGVLVKITPLPAQSGSTGRGPAA